MAEHTWEYCDFCETDFVRCGHCNNNCCNGGTSTLPDGSQCGCKEAYAMQTSKVTQEEKI